MTENKHQTQEEFLKAYELKTKEAIARMAERHAKGPHRVSTIFDKDEMLVNTVANHVDFINTMARRLARKINLDPATLPDYKTVVAAGGTGKIYQELFQITPQQWEAIMERERSTRRINTKAPTYTPNLEALMATVNNNTELLGYLTATPIGVTNSNGRFYDTQNHVEQDIYERLGLPREPAILRPATIPTNQIAPWKTGIMEEIRGANPNKPLILVDDSITNLKYLTAVNAQRSKGEVPLCQILMSEGTLTTRHVNEGTVQENPDLGIYISDWENIPATIDRIQNQWNPQP